MDMISDKIKYTIMGPRIQCKYSQQRHCFRHNEITLDSPRLDFSPIILSINLNFLASLLKFSLKHLNT